MTRRLVVGMTGASGIEYGVDLLSALTEKVETHLIISKWAEKVLRTETDLDVGDLSKLAFSSYSNEDMAAPIASSSFLADGMVVIPASVKTVSEIATSHTTTLIARVADNMLRTRRKLVICLRETPLSTPTLKNLWELSKAGAVIFPLSPAFYHKPKSIQEIRDYIVGKILDLFEVENERFRRWKE